MTDSEREQQLAEAFADLPDRKETVAVPAATAEMADRMGKSREAVALSVYRAVKRFRALSEADR